MGADTATMTWGLWLGLPGGDTCLWAASEYHRGCHKRRTIRGPASAFQTAPTLKASSPDLERVFCSTLQCCGTARASFCRRLKPGGETST